MGSNGEVRIVDRATNETLGPLRPGRRQAGDSPPSTTSRSISKGNIYTAEVADGERVQKFRRIDLQN